MAIDINSLQPVCASTTAGELRFVQRGDKRVLQQRWSTVTSFSDGSEGYSGEWRDVPLIEEVA